MSNIDYEAALHPLTGNTMELRRHVISNSGSLSQETTSFNESYHAGSDLTASQELNLEVPGVGFYESNANANDSLIGGQVGNVTTAAPDSFPFQSGSEESLCFATGGFDCYCPACMPQRVNITSTIANGFDTAQNNHTQANFYNISQGSIHPHSGAFGIRNANSSGDPNFASASLTIPQQFGQGSANTYFRTIGQTNRSSSAISPHNINQSTAYPYDCTLGQIEPQLEYPVGFSGFEYSQTSFDRSNSFSAGVPRRYSELPGNVQNHSSVSTTQPILSRKVMNQPHHKFNRQKPRQKPSKPNVNHSQESREPTAETPHCKAFLETQSVLGLCSEGAVDLSDSQKEVLSGILKVSISQLEGFVEARRVIKPILDSLASASLNLGLSPNHIVTWYLQIQSSKRSSSMSDSAYGSNFNSSPEQTRATKRLKSTGSFELHLKPYQCTFIDSDKSHCPQLSKDYGDWKRHEETHYPQKRWVCLLQESDHETSCHVCSKHIEINRETSTRAHGACLENDYRTGHSFQRKDKLLAHIRSHAKLGHGCDGPVFVETWYQNLPANWRKQCGFCGDIFSEWEQRCVHVGQHLFKGKKMVPDWKDPWPESVESPSQGPDDDQDNDEEHASDRDADQGNRTGKDNTPPESNLGGNGRDHDRAGDRQRDDGQRPNEPSSNHSNKRQHSSRKRNPDKRDSNQRNITKAQSILSGQDLSYSEKPSSSQRSDVIFRSVRKLGYGAFGSVEDVVHSRSGAHFARKTITNCQDSTITWAKFRKEVTALRQLKHGHIIKVLASHGAQDQFSIIMSPVADCNLSEFMRYSHQRPMIQRSYLPKWFGCLASALSYVHSSSWLHMDLKPQNILVFGDRVFLSDFGSAWPIAHHPVGEMENIRCDITPMYCAPELVHMDVSMAATCACDIFSLGCIYLEMATIIHRESVKKFEEFRNFGTGDRSFYRNTKKSKLWIGRLLEICKGVSWNVPGDLLMIRDMLSLDVEKRPSARMIENFYLRSYECDEEKQRTENIYVRAHGKAFDPVAVASAWLKTCEGHHKQCSSPTTDFFPSRILNVGTEGEEIRLQPRLHEFAGPYVTLSHCWGRGNILQTTSETLEERCLGIKSSSLSDDFQKAVQITQALGFHYLWIDSLCILQDSPEDWAEESSKMHEIFSNSYLTISIFNDDQFSPTFGQGSAAKGLAQGDPTLHCAACANNGCPFKPLLEDTASTMLLDSPLSKRCWALQERLLSPRVLHYSSTRLAWECGSVTLAFDAMSEMRNSMRRPIFSYASDTKFIWQDIVREYSKRQLTKPSDRLPALAGLAATIGAVDGCQYLAGLWNDDLKRGILWSRDRSTPPTIRPAYRAPSWSWAAIDTQVEWSKPIFDIREDSETKILGCETTLCSELSRFGGVSDGYIRISGPMRKAVVVYPNLETLLDSKIDYAPFAFGHWDALEITREKHKRNKLGFQINELWCLQVIKGVGLMLKESDMKPEGTFQRVGMYWIKFGKEELLGQTWEIRSITIV